MTNRKNAIAPSPQTPPPAIPLPYNPTVTSYRSHFRERVGDSGEQSVDLVIDRMNESMLF